MATKAERKRQAKLKARRNAKIKEKNNGIQTLNRKKYLQSGVNKTPLMMHLITESNEEKISEENIQFLLTDYDESFNNLKQGKGLFEDHARFAETVFLARYMLSVLNTDEFEPVEEDQKEQYYSLLRYLNTKIENMDKLVFTLHERKKNTTKLYLLDGINSEVKVATEFKEVFAKILRMVDIGIFSRACRKCIETLSNKKKRESLNMGHYSVRENYKFSTEDTKRITEIINDYQEKSGNMAQLNNDIYNEIFKS